MKRRIGVAYMACMNATMIVGTMTSQILFDWIKHPVANYNELHERTSR